MEFITAMASEAIPLERVPQTTCNRIQMVYSTPSHLSPPNPRCLQLPIAILFRSCISQLSIGPLVSITPKQSNLGRSKYRFNLSC